MSTFSDGKKPATERSIFGNKSAKSKRYQGKDKSGSQNAQNRQPHSPLLNQISTVVEDRVQGGNGEDGDKTTDKLLVLHHKAMKPGPGALQDQTARARRNRLPIELVNVGSAANAH